MANFNPINQTETFGNLLRTGTPHKDMQDNIIIVLDKFRTLLRLNGPNEVKFALSEWREMADLIIENFKTISLDDLLKCVQLSVTHAYGDDVDYGHYGRFGIEYISKMLREYQKWKAKYNIDHPALPPANQKALPHSPEASHKTLRKIAQLTYKDLCERDKFFMLDANVIGVFDELTKANLTSDWETLNGNYLKRAELQMKVMKLEPSGKTETVRTKGTSDLASLILKSGVIEAAEKEVDGNIVVLAKKIYIQEKFEYWKKNQRERVFQ